MSNSSPEPRRIEAWMRVLGQVEETLRHCLGRAEERAEPGGVAPTAEASSAALPLRLLDERLARAQSRLEQAERNATAVDAQLAAEAETIGRWQTARAAAGRRLADWAGGAV